jgi:hypothetical protein
MKNSHQFLPLDSVICQTITNQTYKIYLFASLATKGYREVNINKSSTLAYWEKILTRYSFSGFISTHSAVKV